MGRLFQGDPLGIQNMVFDSIHVWKDPYYQNPGILIFFLFLMGMTIGVPDWVEAQESVGLYAYPAPLEDFSSSPFYSVRVYKEEVVLEAFVYQSKARTEGPGTQFVQGRTLSYTGFMATGVVWVEVELLEGTVVEPGEVKIRPSRYNIPFEMVDDRTVRFELSKEGQYTIEFGPLGYLHGLVIVYDPWEANRPDVSNPAVYPIENKEQLDLENLPNQVHTLYFKCGLHDLGGPVELPSQIKQVYLEPGAYVYGAIYIGHSNVVVNGRGVLSSERLRHREANSLETPPAAREVLIDGIFVVDYAKFAIRTLGRNNVVRWVKCIGGWVYNADGLVAWAGTTLRNNFIHADDDAIKLYDDNIIVEDCVIWQMTNGACLQLGWTSLSATKVRVRNIDVVRTEWRPNGGANNSVINLRLASDRGKPNTQSDFWFENIFVETPVDRLLDLRFRNKKPHKNNTSDGSRHHLKNFQFKNIHAQLTSPPNPHTGNLFLPYDEQYGYENIRFENLYINGIRITEQNWETAGGFQIPSIAKKEIHFETGKQ